PAVICFGRGLVAIEELHTLADVARALAEDRRFAQVHVASRGDGYVEVRVSEGGVTLAEARLARDPAAIEPHLVRSRAGSTLLVLIGAEDEFAGLDELRSRVDLAVVPLPISPARLYVTLKNYLDLVALRTRAQERGRWAERYRYELGELIAIARAISSERDISKLFGLIVEKSRYVTGADAGSVYIVEGATLIPRERIVRFMDSQSDSVQIDFREFTFPVDENSIVGRAVITRQPINIPDLYKSDQPHDKQFDRKIGYETRSMLTLPMVN